MLNQQLEKKLQSIVDNWQADFLRRPGGIARAVREFTVAYGNWAYLCGDQFHLGGAFTTDILANQAGLKADMMVLDVACFLGGPARYLARRYGCRVLGLDLSPACIQGATMLTQAEALDHKVTFIQGDAWQMPLSDHFADVVWGQDSWPHKEGLFSECARVLKPGGLIAFTNSVRGDVRAVVADDDISYEAFTAEEYADMLTDVGFDIIRMDDIAHEIIPLWQELEERLVRQLNTWQQLLGTHRMKAEQESLAETIYDYLQGRIGHVRIIARKRR